MENLLCFKVVLKEFARKKDINQPNHDKKIDSKNNDEVKPRFDKETCKKCFSHNLSEEGRGWRVEGLIDGKQFCVRYLSLL